MDLKEHYFDTGEIRLHLMEGPVSGPPLVLLHGATGRWDGWNSVLPRLVQRWHVFTLDQRGHGLSGRAADVEGYNGLRFAADALAFLRGMVREPAVLMGHSWGALVTLLATAPGKDLLRGVVMEDPPLTLRREIKGSNGFLEHFAWLRQLKLDGLDENGIRERLSALNPAVPPEALAGWTQNIAQVDVNFLSATLTGTGIVRGVDFTAAVEGIACPALLMQADTARGAALADVDRDFVLEHSSKVQVARFPDTGHGIHDEKPEEFLEQFEKFMG